MVQDCAGPEGLFAYQFGTLSILQCTRDDFRRTRRATIYQHDDRNIQRNPARSDSHLDHLVLGILFLKHIT